LVNVGLVELGVGRAVSDLRACHCFCRFGEIFINFL
jgi:hypothetical protein